MRSKPLATDRNLKHAPAAGPITRNINLCIYISFFLNAFILGFSLVFYGYYSFWLSEAGILLTLIHHWIILSHRSKLQKPSPKASSSTAPLLIPVSARKPMVFLAWFIALIFTAACGVVISFLVLSARGSGHWTGYWKRIFYVAEALELTFLVIEVSVVGRIALWSMKERRAVLRAHEVEWYRLPQYNQSP